MATTGYCVVGSGSKDGECAAATAVARTSARARAGAMRRQQHQHDWGQRCDDSCEDDSKGDAARQGQHSNDNGGILHIASTAVVRPTVTVVARARAMRQQQWGTAAAVTATMRTTARATVARKGECSGNNGGSVSHLSLIFFSLVGLRTLSQGSLFCLIQLSRDNTQTTVRLYM